jgi:multiple antibiotic resistance protein
MADWTFLIHAFAGLFAILNPIGALPIYIATLSNSPESVRRAAPRQIAITVLLALTLFAFMGDSVINFFGISLPAFRAGGGILILLMAIAMLQGRVSHMKHAPEDEAEAAEADSGVIVPLGIPMLVGPGSMSTALLLGEKADGPYQHVVLVGVIVALGVLCFVLFSSADVLARVLKGTGIRVMSRIMGLILAAMAMQFIADGLGELFPGLVNVVGATVTE